MISPTAIALDEFEIGGDKLASAPQIQIEQSEEPCDFYDRMAQGLVEAGYSVSTHALPLSLACALIEYCQSINHGKFENANIGRGEQKTENAFVRTDEIHWINGTNDIENRWLRWAEQLMLNLNRRLYLGLFSFESHFSHYKPGDFYKRHVDAFKGEKNRVLSLVTYLNPVWHNSDGGELVLYSGNGENTSTIVQPKLGTVALFLSEEIPHEVLPTYKDRYAIAGWFRVNGSSAQRIDPPR